MVQNTFVPLDYDPQTSHKLATLKGAIRDLAFHAESWRHNAEVTAKENSDIECLGEEPNVSLPREVLV